MNATIEIHLENERALLRPLRLDDLANLLPFSLKEPEIWTYSLISAHGEANMLSYIEAALLSRKQETAYPFIVFDKLANRYAGCTRFYDIQLSYKTLQLGYTWYGKDFQRTGLNRHCKYLLFKYAFETLNMERVELRADNDNTRSIAAMKAIGCKAEGILRSNMPKPAPNTERRDSIVLSVLKAEWYAEVKALIESKIG